MAIRLTERDLDIMLALARNGFMTIDQIQNKWFPSYSACARRLLKLRQHKIIKVDYIERHGRGIYSLTKNGLRFVNDYYGCSYKNYARSSKINHFISCSELYLHFPYKILEYELEYYLGELIPDIYVKYRNIDEIDLLVEIDNTNRKSIINNKIKSYNQYLNLGTWKDCFDRFPKCMIITDVKLDKIESKIPFVIIGYKNIKNIGGIL